MSANGYSLEDKYNFVKIQKRVLIVGPDYRNHFGGIGSVIESYRLRFKYFNFFPTFRGTNKYFKVFYSLKQLFIYPFYLILHPGIDIIHIHGSSFGSFYRKYFVFLLSKYIFFKKVIYHIHGSEFQIFCDRSGLLTRKFLCHFINNTDILICLSENWKEFFLTRYKPKRIEILNNYIDIKLIHDFAKKENEKVIFLSLGKIGKRKGIFDLLEVAKKMVNQEKKNFEIWIGGDGEIKKLVEFIDENTLGDTIKYLGWVSGEKKSEILRMADVYILPSYNEGMPISILEAMAYGMPVISTFVGGIPELVKANESGILIEPGDLEKLQQSMEYFLNDSNEISVMGKRGKKIILGGFTAEIVMEKLFSLYCQSVR